MRRAAVLALALAAAPALLRGAEIDPFYLEIEHSARAAQARGDATEAARLYRIACFGMLDQPERLGACLARLGIAQARAGERAEFDATFRRLATVEERFQAFGRAPLAVEERAELLRAAGELLTPEQWALAPKLAPEIARAHAESVAEAGAAAKKPSRQRREPAAVEQLEPSGGSEDPAAMPLGEAPDPAPTSPGAAELVVVESARALLDGTPQIAEVERALARLLPIADAWPGETGMQQVAALLAYRASRWPACVRYFRRAGEPGLERPLERFYLAVCLYETGERAEAARVIAPSAAELRRTPFVARYLDRILGESRAIAP